MNLIDAVGKEWLLRHVKEALSEDVGDRGDVTCQATVSEDMLGHAKLYAKANGVLAGVDWAVECGNSTEPSVKWIFHKHDGDFVKKGDLLADVNGSMRGILISERTALNGLGHLSGIATYAWQAAEAVEGTKAKVIDTRKTFPGWRFAQKYAVRAGGGDNHRIGLYDEILIKENHIEAAGGVAEAVITSKEWRKRLEEEILVPIEIEVETLEELKIALKSSPDRILLDNFTPDRLKEAVKLTDGECILEASGGITFENLREVALTGVNRISMGAMTHSVVPLDMSLLVR